MSSKQNLSKLNVAIRTVEDDVPEPTRKRSSSFTSVIADLAVGETASRAVAVDPTLTLEEIAAILPAEREKLRNTCAPSMRHAGRETGGTYTIEIADCMTSRRSLFIVALVTRTA